MIEIIFWLMIAFLVGYSFGHGAGIQTAKNVYNHVKSLEEIKW